MKMALICFLSLSVAMLSFCGCINNLRDYNKVTHNTSIERNHYYKTDIITGASIEERFKGVNVTTEHDRYWRPSEKWIMETVVPYFMFLEYDNNVSYNHKFNCVVYTQTFITCAALLYNQVDKKGDAPAIGECHYYIDPVKTHHTSHHSINIIVLDTGEIVFFEPQQWKFVTLTPEEIQSIDYIRF